MPLTRVNASSLAEFDAALAAALATPGERVFTLFSGKDGWCPDCEAAAPTLEAVFAEAGAGAAVTLITAKLVRDEYKGNASHWARAHARVKLARIPTLHKWGAAKKVAELVEGECADAERVRELVVG